MLIESTGFVLRGGDFDYQLWFQKTMNQMQESLKAWNGPVHGRIPENQTLQLKVNSVDTKLTQVYAITLKKLHEKHSMKKE